ncbi:hypothetical protein P5W98_03155 [Paraburkholderia sp. A1BS-2L]|uniref:hypothetical protein n=1 Tax=Paraburkholderia sp. A1BS-2L TaxID=3028373 RepID=UPI003DA8756B
MSDAFNDGSRPALASARGHAGHVAAASFVVLVVVALRLAVLGGYPSTDEGFYAYYALIMHDALSQHMRLPNEGMLMLYSLLTSFVYSLDINPIFALRLVDIVPDALAAVLMLRISVRLSGSRTASAFIVAIFFALLNHPVFIQYGFKNSFFIALCPLLYAVVLFMSVERASASRYFVIGVLVACGVLLRETLAVAAVLGAVSVLAFRGVRALAYYALGGLAAGALVLAFLTMLRGPGGLASLIAGYVDAGAGYGALALTRWALFESNGALAARTCIGALLLSFVAAVFVLVVSIRRGSSRYLGSFAFWAAVALLALIEPLAKIGFPYHFSWSLIGLCGIASLGWGVARSTGAGRAWTVAAGGLCLAVSLVSLLPQLKYVRDIYASLTYPAFKETRGRYWAEDSVAHSNYLLMAEQIRRVAPPHATLSSSGAMLILYPLTGLRPPCYALSNLTFMFVTLHLDEPALKRAIEQCPADVIASTRRDLPGRRELTEAMKQLPQYRHVGAVGRSDVRDYGSFEADVYIRRR